MGRFDIPANIHLDIVQSPLGYTCCFFKFLPLAFSVLCRFFLFSDPLSKFYSVQFRPFFSFKANPLFYPGPYAVVYGMVLIWKYLIEGSMFLPICILVSFGMD
jgi:hypothetical protein